MKISATDLLCPYCRSNNLKLNEGALHCANEYCNRDVLILHGKPVLINFDLSVVDKDIFLADSGESTIPRKHRPFVNFLKHVLIGDSAITKRNFVNISETLKKIDNLRILVVGGGTIGAGLTDFYKEFKEQIISFDIYDSDNIDFIADAHNIPIKDNAVDFIIIQAVLEHVINPQKVVAECHRVLKKDGLIYAETPFMQQIHEGPYDFTRFSDSGHRSLFKNFNLISSGAVAGVGTSLMWSFSYFFSGLFRSRKVGKVFRSLFFWLRFFDYLVSDPYNIDGASCVFFYGNKSTTSITDRQLIAYYKGGQQ